MTSSLQRTLYAARGASQQAAPALEYLLSTADVTLLDLCQRVGSRTQIETALHTAAQAWAQVAALATAPEENEFQMEAQVQSMKIVHAQACLLRLAEAGRA